MWIEQYYSLGPVSLQVASGPRNGPPLVLFHGVSRRWQDFGLFLPTLSSRWQVFAVDHRGHGKSSRADSYLATDYIADAAAFVKHLEQPPILIGHSLGALTAIGVAAAIPQKIRGVILEDPPSAGFLARIDEGPYGMQFRAMRDLAGGTRSTSDVTRALAAIPLPDGSTLGDWRDAATLRFHARCLNDLDPQVLTPVIEKRWLDGFDPIVAAAKVQCPALLLIADPAAGGMLPSTDANALASALVDGYRIDFRGVGHLIHGMKPDLFIQPVMNFLDSF